MTDAFVKTPRVGAQQAFGGEERHLCVVRNRPSPPISGVVILDSFRPVFVADPVDAIEFNGRAQRIADRAAEQTAGEMRERLPAAPLPDILPPVFDKRLLRHGLRRFSVSVGRGLAQARDLSQCLLAAHPLLHQVTARDRASTANAAPAVHIKHVAFFQRIRDEPLDLAHQLNRRNPEVGNRQSSMNNHPYDFLGLLSEQRRIRPKPLILFCQIEKACHSGVQKRPQLHSRLGLSLRSRIFTRQQLAGNQPIRIRYGCVLHNAQFENPPFP